MRYLGWCILFLQWVVLSVTVDATLAGGRPNAFSEGQNAFAGVVNPANAVWIADRLDVGIFGVHQQSSLYNCNNNPAFLPGKTDLTYKAKGLFTADAAIHKQGKVSWGTDAYDSSISLATYTVPSLTKLRTRRPIPSAGTTPMRVLSKTEVVSAVFSLKLQAAHSVGFSLEYLTFARLRNGFQHTDTPQRSVSPGHVTNKGMDRAHGVGCTIGWRWNITEKLNFGTAWSKKSYGGSCRKYRGFEPHHAENYQPQTLGAGFSYRVTSRLAGRLELLWMNLGNIPSANNNVLPNGSLNRYKRGSRRSPGPGTENATYVNVGAGYKYNERLSLGVGFSHRIKRHAKEHNILSHTYRLQTIYDTLSLGANFNYEKHDLFLVLSYGCRNRVTGFMPPVLGGGRIKAERQYAALSLSWGYAYGP